MGKKERKLKNLAYNSMNRKKEDKFNQDLNSFHSDTEDQNHEKLTISDN